MRVSTREATPRRTISGIDGAVHRVPGFFATVDPTSENMLGNPIAERRRRDEDTHRIRAANARITDGSVM